MDIKQQSSAEKASEFDESSIKDGTSWTSKFSVETAGIERVTDEERLSNTTHVWNACTFW